MVNGFWTPTRKRCITYPFFGVIALFFLALFLTQGCAHLGPLTPEPRMPVRHAKAIYDAGWNDGFTHKRTYYAGSLGEGCPTINLKPGQHVTFHPDDTVTVDVKTP